MADAAPLAPPVAYSTDSAARAKVAFVVIKSLCSSITGVLMGVNWVDMTGQQQFLAVLAVVINLVVAIEALYDKTMSSRAAGKAAGGTTNPPFPPKDKP